MAQTLTHVLVDLQSVFSTVRLRGCLCILALRDSALEHKSPFSIHFCSENVLVVHSAGARRLHGFPPVPCDPLLLLQALSATGSSLGWAGRRRRKAEQGVNTSKISAHSKRALLQNPPASVLSGSSVSYRTVLEGKHCIWLKSVELGAESSA